MNPKVDAYLSKAKKWQAGMKQLRTIILDSELTEELKWGKPCYTIEGANVVLIVGFKAYCALLFAKGALLKDPKSILIQPTENTQAARQIRFTSVEQVRKLGTALKRYVKNAIDVEKAGLQVKYKKITEFTLPEELQISLDEDRSLKKAFTAL